jgi:hypothetical protein
LPRLPGASCTLDERDRAALAPPEGGALGPSAVVREHLVVTFAVPKSNYAKKPDPVLLRRDLHTDADLQRIRRVALRGQGEDRRHPVGFRPDEWAQTLQHHLLPAFGPMLVDTIRHADVARWRVPMAERIHGGTYSPHTVNTWLSVMRVILKAAAMQLELARNPMDGIKNFDTSEHVYTEEEPNSLTVQEMPAFLSKMRALCPQHFAFVCLGFFLGHRPSTLRPLRRSGPTPDVLLDEGILLVRQSRTEGDEVIATTKTKIRQRITFTRACSVVIRYTSMSLLYHLGNGWFAASSSSSRRR